MKKVFDIVIAFLIGIFSIIIFIYEFLLSSDIPVNISFIEFRDCLIGLLLLLVIFSIYFKYTKAVGANLILLIPLGFWIQSMIPAVIDSYQDYHAVLTILGVTVNTLCLVQVHYRIHKQEHIKKIK